MPEFLKQIEEEKAVTAFKLSMSYEVLNEMCNLGFGEATDKGWIVMLETKEGGSGTYFIRPTTPEQEAELGKGKLVSNGVELRFVENQDELKLEYKYKPRRDRMMREDPIPGWHPADADYIEFLHGITETLLATPAPIEEPARMGTSSHAIRTNSPLDRYLFDETNHVLRLEAGYAPQLESEAREQFEQAKIIISTHLLNAAPAEIEPLAAEWLAAFEYILALWHQPSDSLKIEFISILDPEHQPQVNTLRINGQHEITILDGSSGLIWQIAYRLAILCPKPSQDRFMPIGQTGNGERSLRFDTGLLTISYAPNNRLARMTLER